MFVKIPAKLNLYVQVGQRRENGYHDIITVFQAISLYDTMEITPTKYPSGLTISVVGMDEDKIPADSRNLVIKAARLLANHIGVQPNAHFHLNKSIPTEAGLGGGSADAAAALIACSHMWSSEVSESTLLSLAVQVDEDTAFFVKGMMALGTGLNKPPMSLECGNHTWNWVLVVLQRGLSTKLVYEKYDEVLASVPIDSAAFQAKHEECQRLRWGLTSPRELSVCLMNDLEKAAVKMLPDVEAALSVGRAEGALACIMAGAGSTCAFLAEDEGHARSLALALKCKGVFRRVIVADGPVDRPFISTSRS